MSASVNLHELPDKMEHFDGWGVDQGFRVIVSAGIMQWTRVVRDIKAASEGQVMFTYIRKPIEADDEYPYIATVGQTIRRNQNTQRI